MRPLVFAAVFLASRVGQADDFYTKQVEYAGIPIRAHAIVADAALTEAQHRLGLLLDHAPAIAARLAQAGVELHIIGKDQVTSDLPEWRHLAGKPFDGDLDVDQRTRGLGSQLSSCGEENLLHLPGDRYAGLDICVHEFAHAIASYGVPPEVRTAIEDQYARATVRGLWAKAYAGTNVEEYFAELSMLHVGTAHERARLEAEDPEAAALLDDLYSGRLVRLQPARITVTASTGVATSIHFENTRTESIRVYWVDDRGARHLYRTLAPGAGYDQATYAGHAWLVTSGRGSSLAGFVATPDPRVARVH